ncbi:TlpA family protein disulfide reductase [Rhodopirellula sp. P2]|uniref:TlpA family protein disulfide reductase n=1 Tax=Rhodopirellula sp. P2 TaxID=2127060 RepID=UPI00236759EC|nr:TlpA disulfide reductase family protein [Rhodopirellula sp. P2]WDQ18360.1 TlpA disulfide reductase family protein [Rhodopirellula sp. P2]
MIGPHMAFVIAHLPKTVWAGVVAILLTPVVGGCTRQPPAESTENADATENPGLTDSGQLTANALPTGDAQASGSPMPNAGQGDEVAPLHEVAPRSEAAAANKTAPIQVPQTITSGMNGQGKQLAHDLSPEKLRTFLSEADVEMRMIVSGESGIEDEATAIGQLKRIVSLKREASRRLIEHADSSPRERSIGRRGELQSLSHLASMGDLKSAESLQELAEELQNDSDPDVRSDSQLVLIGFAIENLRNGKSEAAAKVVSQIDRLLQSSAAPDAATLMVMGQARDALMQFEHVEEASRVRSMILEEFVEPIENGADEASEMVGLADMARQIAGPSLQVSEATRRVQQLMQQFITEANENTTAADSAVSPSDWKEAVQTLADEQPDLLTTQFLAGASLEAETVGREDLMSVTYQVLDDKFASLQDDRGREARAAIQARDNRQKIIGKAFDPDLPSTQGEELSLESYRGKVVLMPFWSAAFPDSLLVVDNLQEIARQYPEKVAIVGMNLDVQSTDVPAFESRNKISFPSFRSVSDPEASVANSIAYRFGAVSLLFVAVIDQSGQVHTLEFSGRDLTPVVENLLR